MPVRTFNLFFGLLTLACFAFCAVTWALALASRVSEAGAGLFGRFRDEVGPIALQLAWTIAAVAMLGSLYYSGVAHFAPCKYCWYQRIGIYPWAIILGIAAFRRDVSIRVYAIPVLAVSSLLSVYHILIERFPDVFGDSCSAVGPPCAIIYFEQFGFITLPVMALTAAVTMITALTLAQTPAEAATEDEDGAASGDQVPARGATTASAKRSSSSRDVSWMTT